MRVRFSVVGRPEQYPLVEVDLPAVPVEGQTVNLPDLEAGFQTVRTVVWYPFGDPEPEPVRGTRDPSPFVYVVLGPARP